MRIKRAIVCLACYLLLFCACNHNSSRDFYLLMQQDHTTEYAMDVLIEQQIWDLDDDKSIPLRIGIGYDHMTSDTTGKVATLTVTVRSDLDKDQDKTWILTYDDFFTNEKYKADVKENWFGHDKLTPRYHSIVEIVLPDGETEGDIIIELTTTAMPYSADKIEIDYIKNDTTVIFYDQYTSTGPYTGEKARELFDQLE